MSGWFYGTVLVMGAGLFYGYNRMGRLFGCVLFTALSGLGALLLLRFVGSWLPVQLVVTPFTALVSVLLGIPGVLAMLLLNLM